MRADKPIDEAFFRVCQKAALEGIWRTLEITEGGLGFATSYGSYPSLKWNENGFPILRANRLSKVLDYRSVHLYSTKDRPVTRVSAENLASFEDVFQYSQESPPIRKHFGRSLAKPELEDTWARSGVAVFLGYMIDRLIHCYGGCLEEDSVRDVYLPLEFPIFNNRLPIDVLVPIVLLSFEEDTIPIAEGIDIRRLTEEEQLARCPLDRSYTTAVNDMVLSAATHAFVLADRSIDAATWKLRREEIPFAPVDEIDLLFESLRLATGLATGYAQVVFRPLGWTEEYVGRLEPLISRPRVRAYPSWFENWSWTSPRPVASRGRLIDVPLVWSVLNKRGPNLPKEGGRRLATASRRLNASMLREREEDALVDLCVGLEALLGDDTGTEMTHKLALRAAGVLARYPGNDLPAGTVFNAIKHAYRYRSKLVHGKQPKESLKTFQLGDQTVSTRYLTEHLLRQIALALTKSPEWLEPDLIDRTLILASLDDPST